MLSCTRWPTVSMVCTELNVLLKCGCKTKSVELSADPCDSDLNYPELEIASDAEALYSPPMEMFPHRSQQKVIMSRLWPKVSFERLEDIFFSIRMEGNLTGK